MIASASRPSACRAPMPIGCGMSTGSIGRICHLWRRGRSIRIRIFGLRITLGGMAIRYVFVLEWQELCWTIVLTRLLTDSLVCVVPIDGILT